MQEVIVIIIILSFCERKDFSFFLYSLEKGRENKSYAILHCLRRINGKFNSLECRW